MLHRSWPEVRPTWTGGEGVVEEGGAPRSFPRSRKLWVVLLIPLACAPAAARSLEPTPRGERQTSEDGLELHFAVNYLAGILLTHLLLDRLTASDSARVVNVASALRSVPSRISGG